MNQKEQIKVFLDLYDVSRETMEKLSIYEKLIIEGQRKYSLVGKSTLGNIWLRHFADSAKVLDIIRDIYLNNERKILKLIDIGSGAGFPGGGAWGPGVGYPGAGGVLGFGAPGVGLPPGAGAPAAGGGLPDCDERMILSRSDSKSSVTR